MDKHERALIERCRYHASWAEKARKAGDWLAESIHREKAFRLTDNSRIQLHFELMDVMRAHGIVPGVSIVNS